MDNSDPTDPIDPAEAESLIRQFDRQPNRPLFSSPDRTLAARYLRAIGSVSGPVLQLAMARLEDELRTLLSTRATPLNFNGATFQDCNSLGPRSNRSTSIREIPLLPDDAVDDARAIVGRMTENGYFKECVQVHVSVRKAALDVTLSLLGVDRISISDIQRADWAVLEGKIRDWIRAVKILIRVLFPSERRLLDLLFGGSDPGSEPFSEIIKGSAIRILNFAEGVSICKRAPEKLFRIVDMMEALSDLVPDMERVSDPIRAQSEETVDRLKDCARGTLTEFETAVQRDRSDLETRGGAVHPMISYVMNYMLLLAEYKGTIEPILSSPSSSSSIISSPSSSSTTVEPVIEPNIPSSSSSTTIEPNIPSSSSSTTIEPVIEPIISSSSSPLSGYLRRLIDLLETSLEAKAGVYKDQSLQHFFLTNNVHYIVNKIRGNEELVKLIGVDYQRRLTGKYMKSAADYRRSWVRVVKCLNGDGLPTAGPVTSAGRAAIKERFKAFYAVFEGVQREQAVWIAHDQQLKEELRISVSDLMVPAYRAFLGRFAGLLQGGRHGDACIKYSVESLESALLNLFEGSTQNRRRS